LQLSLCLRIITKLQALKDSPYEMQYHHHLQGFVYSLLRGTEFHYLHDKKGYKFFCFSNIFPIGDIKRGNIRNLIISSPNREFIEIVFDRLQKMSDNGTFRRIGTAEFSILDATVIEEKNLTRSVSLISGTPIVIRIQKERYGEYNLNPPKPYPYLYWRSTYPLEVFIKQLEDNLRKKYVEFFHDEVPEEPVFQRITFLKQVSNKVIVNREAHVVIGSVWKFGFDSLDSLKSELIRFGMDSGLGERNSLGFGFMNLLSNK